MIMFAFLTLSLWLIIYYTCGLWYAATIASVAIVICSRWVVTAGVCDCDCDPE